MKPRYFVFLIKNGRIYDIKEFNTKGQALQFRTKDMEYDMFQMLILTADGWTLIDD